MKHLSRSKAATYSPSTEQANNAAKSFIESANAWGAEFARARDELKSYLAASVGVKANGFLSSDPLNMSVFGIVFENSPGAGFMAVPGAMSDRLADRGLRGVAYFPDTKTELGREVMSRLVALSRVAEQRPLLSGVPGVKPVAIEGNRIVLSRATTAGADGEVRVLAAKSAVAPDAQVSLVVAPKLEATAPVSEHQAAHRAEAAPSRPKPKF